MVKFSMSIDQFITEFKKNYAKSNDANSAIQQTLYSLGVEYLVVVDKVTLEGFPLGSLTASGKFKDYVYVTRAGKSYVKKYTIPFDPKTKAQIEHRTQFAQATADWLALSQPEKDGWNELSKGKPYSGFNLFVSNWFDHH